MTGNRAIESRWVHPDTGAQATAIRRTGRAALRAPCPLPLGEACTASMPHGASRKINRHRLVSIRQEPTERSLEAHHVWISSSVAGRRGHCGVRGETAAATSRRVSRWLPNQDDIHMDPLGVWYVQEEFPSTAGAGGLLPRASMVE